MRTLELLREEILIRPILNRVFNKTNVFVAPMRIGKTFAIYNKHIPNLKNNEDVKKFICTAPEKSIHTQSKAKYYEILTQNKIRIFTLNDIDEYYRYPKASVLIITNKTFNNKFDELWKMRERFGLDKVALFADEIHQEGTTSMLWTLENTGYLATEEAKQIFARNLLKWNKNTDLCFAMTATPLWEMFADNVNGLNVYGQIEDLLKYNILINQNQWPSSEERLLYTSRLHNITFSEKWMDERGAPVIDRMFDDRKSGLLEFHKTSKEIHRQILKYAEGTQYYKHLIETLDPRIISHVTVGATYVNYNAKNIHSKNLEQVKDQILNLLRNNRTLKEEEDLIDRDMLSINGYKARVLIRSSNGNYKYNIKGEFDKLHDDLVQYEMDNGDIEFVLTVDTFKNGATFPRWVFTTQVRLRKQDKGRVVPNGVLQGTGRSAGLWFGSTELENIKDVHKFLATIPRTFVDLRKSLCDWFNHFNKQHIFWPKEAIYIKAQEEYLAKFACTDQLGFGECTCGECKNPYCQKNKAA